MGVGVGKGRSERTLNSARPENKSFVGDAPRVVVLGAGFGGLRVARALGGKPVDVTLIDQNNYHLFQPLLYQVATSTLSPDSIAYPVRGALQDKRNQHFQLGTVQSVDLAARQVVTGSAVTPYDYLVIAVGGQTNFFGIESVEQHSFGIKDLQDATAIRNHLLRQFESAVLEPDPQKRRAMLTFVIVGGGPTGVECAGAISELIRLVLRRDYPRLNFDDVQVILLEMMDKVLAMLPEELGQATVEALRKKHVEVRLQASVASYDGQEVCLKDGSTIPTNTLIWSAGVRASTLLDTLDLEQDRAGRVMVGSTLQVPGRPEVFVIGDAAHLEGKDGKPLPMVAPVAMQQASTAARNILHAINGEPLEDFHYRDRGTMATIGRNHAVAHIGSWKFRGFIAWLMWLAVHIVQLIGFRNRLAVLIDWGWSYLFYQRAVRLIGPP